MILLTLPTVAIGLGVGSLGLVAAYPFMKRITWWPQAWLGLTFNGGALMGFAAALPLAAAALPLPADIAGEFRPFLWSPASDSGHAIALAWQAYIPAVLLWIGGVFWTLGYDTIYAHMDKEDDVLIGVKSTALRLGNATRDWLVGFYAVTLVGIAASGWLAGLGWAFFALLVPAAGHLVWQHRVLKIDDPKNCLFLFRANRFFGWIVLAAIVAGNVSR